MPITPLDMSKILEDGWDIPGWGSAELFSSPVTSNLAYQAFGLRCAHVVLNQGLSYFLIPPLVLCLLVKMDEASSRIRYLRAIVQTVQCTGFILLGSAIVAGALVAAGVLVFRGYSVHELLFATTCVSLLVTSLIAQSEQFWIAVGFVLIFQLFVLSPKFPLVTNWLKRAHHRTPYLLMALLAIAAPWAALYAGIPLPQEDFGDLGDVVGPIMAQFMTAIYSLAIAWFFLWCKWTTLKQERGIEPTGESPFLRASP